VDVVDRDQHPIRGRRPLEVIGDAIDEKQWLAGQPLISWYSAAVSRGSRPLRSSPAIGAPGDACSISSHLLLATLIRMCAAWRHTSDNSAGFRSRGRR
jgi:hypothetical protein